MALTLKQFTEQLIQSGLMPASQLTAYLRSLPERPVDAESLAKQLISAKKLTSFQAQQVWKKKAKHLVLGNYTISEKLGQGGMGMVFKASHKLMKRDVALKVLPPAFTKDEQAVKRFLREVEAAAKLTHPHIVAALDADHVRDSYFLIMEYVEGRDLSVLVKKQGPAKAEQAIDFVLQAARGLEYAHQNGVIHRDIKPANLLLDKSGTVKVLDMGLARIEGDSSNAATLAGLTGSGTMMGTIDYMAPEQADDSKRAGPQADIYSLGATLHFLLTAQPMIEGDTVGKKLRVLLTGVGLPESIQTKRPDIPAELDAVFCKMTAFSMSDRYLTMSEVIADLESLQAGTTPQSVSSTGIQPVAAVRSDESAMNSFLNHLDDGTEVIEQTLTAPPVGTTETDTITSHVGEATKPAISKAETFAATLKVPKYRIAVIGGSIGAALLLGALIWTLSPGGSDTPVPEDDSAAESHNQQQPSEVIKIANKGSAPPLASPPMIAGDDRAVAEWVLEIGGTTKTDAGDFTTVDQLPERPFHVTEISIDSIVGVRDEDFDRLNGLNHLVKLYLHGLSISDDACLRFAELPELNNLYLSQTSIGNKGLSYLNPVQSQLTELTLRACKVTDVGLKNLRGMVNLERLGITHSSTIGDEGLTDIVNLPKLTSLALSQTQVTDAGLNHIKKLTNLESLNVTGTKVTEAGVAKLQKALPKCRITWERKSDPDRVAAEWVVGKGGMIRTDVGRELEIKAAAELPPTSFRITSIDLTDIKDVTDRELARFERLTNLTELRLSNTGVSNSGLRFLKGLAQLKWLSLIRTDVSDAGLEHLTRLQSLARLNLSDTRISNDGLKHLGTLPNLRELILERTSVDDEGLAQLQRIEFLRHVGLAGTRITNAGLAHLKGIKRLSILDVEQTKVSNDGLKHLNGMTALTRLELSDSRVDDDGLKHLTSLANLNYLIFGNLRISDEGLRHLKGLKRLTYIDLVDTQVTAAGVAELQRALPRCKIEWDGAN